MLHEIFSPCYTNVSLLIQNLPSFFIAALSLETQEPPRILLLSVQIGLNGDVINQIKLTIFRHQELRHFWRVHV